MIYWGIIYPLDHALHDSTQGKIYSKGVLLKYILKLTALHNNFILSFILAPISIKATMLRLLFFLKKNDGRCVHRSLPNFILTYFINITTKS